VLKLPEGGALHSLMVRARVTNGATEGRLVTILDALDRIEVIGNGSQVLYSLIPEVIEKRFEARHGSGIPFVQNHRADAVQEATFEINFGRQFYDGEMYLPLNRFSDAELRLQFSPVIAASEGFATGTMTFDVLALVSTQLPAVYLGTLVTRNIKNFTSAASGEEQTDLHLGNVYRDVFIYAYEAAIADGVDVTDVELRVNDGETSIIRNNWNELLLMNGLKYGANIQHEILDFVANNDVVDTRLSEPEGIAIANQSTAVIATDLAQFINVDGVAGDRLTYDINQGKFTAASEDLTAQTTKQPVRTVVSKNKPSNGVLLPFDWSPDPNTWLDSASLSRLQVLLTQGGAGPDVRISTSEIRRF